MSIRNALVFAACGWLLLLGGCQRAPEATAPAAGPPLPALAASKPAQAIHDLTAHLRGNDLAGFAQAAVPPTLHAQLEQAWGAGKTRWPLDELPFASRLPRMLHALAAPGSEAQLQSAFDHQLAGQRADIHSAARALGQFGVAYISREGHYSDDERQHYAQLLQAASDWAAQAPLGDRQRAQQAIGQLAAAARRTGLDSDDTFARLGMHDSLARMGPFLATFKQVLVTYGLTLDADLATMKVSLQQQTGDQARVRMQYRFGGSDIDTTVAMQRIDGRWYLVDYLRHARAAVGPP